MFAKNTGKKMQIIRRARITCRASIPQEFRIPKKIYLYEYDNGSKSAAFIDRYLEGYKGILVSDGYASYHTLDRKHDELKVAICRVHSKRKYA